MAGSLELTDAHNPNAEVLPVPSSPSSLSPPPPPITSWYLTLAYMGLGVYKEWAKGPEDFIELFLTTLLMLNHRRKRNEAHLPPKGNPRSLSKHGRHFLLNLTAHAHARTHAHTRHTRSREAQLGTGG